MKLGIQVERRQRLESDCHRRRRAADIFRLGARLGIGKFGGGGCFGSWTDGEHAGEDQVAGCEGEQGEAESAAEVGFEVGDFPGFAGAEGDDEARGEEEGKGLEGAPG